LPPREYTASVPPEEAANAGEGTKFPDFSVRVDPLNWLLLGRLGFELEVELLELLTV
jgi:hypothetical protein